jgi:hypothetical protein
MQKLSISRAWEETRVVLQREGKLIGAVALALLVLPGLLVNAVVPAARAGEMPAPGLWIVAGLVALLISLIGQLSIVRLAMGPPTTVGQAIEHGARRMLPLLGAFLIWALPLLIVLSSLYAMLRADPTHPSGVVALGMLALSVAGIFLAVRLLLLGPVASAEPIGPIAILRRSWEITAGNWWRLFGFVAIFFVGVIVLLLATASVFGLIARMFLGGVEPMSLGWLVVMLASQLLSSLVYVVLFVMQARLYVQHSANTDATAEVFR